MKIGVFLLHGGVRKASLKKLIWNCVVIISHMRLRAESLASIYSLSPDLLDQHLRQAATKYVRHQLDSDYVDSQLWFLKQCKRHDLVPKGLVISEVPKTLEKSRHTFRMHQKYQLNGTRGFILQIIELKIAMI